ncbi:uncharacterized protein STEHIDRAFT_44293, partial [Stereum hirsutum FP-91666 SS1]|uniref:uncharacterized protein n=1 Tax=Stereum hirsutum (strain FP-91666) TaxID=721885 RepID=UPI0004449B68
VRDTKYITALENTAIFVHVAVTGMSFRHVCQRFQHSLDTISKIFYTVLNSLVAKNFYWQYVFLPPDETPSAIRDDPKFYPFFKDVCAAVDGSQYGAY